jgi:hypothetical protein
MLRMPGNAPTTVAVGGPIGHITPPPGSLETARPSGGRRAMGAKSQAAERARVERMRSLAQRCRDLSEQTAVPEVTRELVSIADALESEAELVVQK